MTFHCFICVKDYASKRSLYNHCRRFHNGKNELKTESKSDKLSMCTQNAPFKRVSMHHKKYKCDYCLNEYKYHQGKYRHQKKCPKRKYKEETESLRETVSKLKDELKEAKSVINNTTNNITTNNSNNTYNNTYNNTINATINIKTLGNEDTIDIFTDEEKIAILKKRYDALAYIIKYTHFNPKYPQFHNIKLNSINSSYGKMYCNKEGRFITVPKTELIENVKLDRLIDLENYYDDYKDELQNSLKRYLESYITNLYKPEYSKKQNTKIASIIHNGTKTIDNTN
jgi:hypothetical protein